MEDRAVSMDKYCRTCLSTTNEPLINLFDQNDTNIYSKVSLPSMILSVAFIEMSFGDGLSDQVCQSCVEKASIAYDFKVLCEKSDDTLRKSKELLIKNTEGDNDNEKEVQLLSNDNNKLSTDIYKNILDDLSLQNEQDIKLLNDKQGEICSVDKNDDYNLKELNIPISVPVESKLSCLICLETFENHSQLREHKKTHPADMKHNCHICGKSFTRIYSLHYHMVTHTDFKQHLCPECGKTFHLASGLRQHLKYHKGTKSHICDICNKSYLKFYLLKEHMRCAHSSNRYNISCSVCNKKFTAKSTLKAHMNIHTGERSHACEVCGKRFTRAAYLKAHRVQHTQDPPPRVFVCQYDNCEQVYSSKSSLDIHIRHKHTGERPYSCEVCNKSFSALPGLNEHRRVHTGEKPEECVLCGNHFVNKQSLKKHMRLHTGERPYSCDHCEERFVSSSRRSEHIQTKHMDRLHECHICHKRFHLNRTLKGHLRTHSGEKHVKEQTLSQAPEEPPVNADPKQNVPEPRFEVIV